MCMCVNPMTISSNQSFVKFMLHVLNKEEYNLLTSPNMTDFDAVDFSECRFSYKRSFL